MHALAYRYENCYVSLAPLAPEELKKFSCRSWLVAKNYNEIKKANNFWLVLSIAMRLVLIDSVDSVDAENIDSIYAIIGRTSCLPFWFILKIYFFKLLLDRWSDFHLIWPESFSDHVGKSYGYVSKRF